MEKAPVSNASLETRGLVVGYEGHAIVSGVDLSVRSGQIVTLIGPNGAGKSTVLKSIARQLDLVGGAVYVDGSPLDELDPGELAREMSVVLTERPSTELMTCADVVEAGRYPYTGRLGILDGEDRAIVRDAMELTDTWSLRERDFMHVSDGQRQRIMLARAICQQPRVIVLDEPTSFLDIRYQIELLDILRGLVSTRDVAVLMSLHELSLARIVSDEVICIKDGTVFAQGPSADIFVPEVIDELYGLEPGAYDPVTGNVVLGLAHHGGQRR